MRASGRVILGAALVLSACSSETKLFDRSLPDETKVIDGPSLAVPPDMQLRPPREAADYESVLRDQKTAEGQALITGVSATAAVSGSAGVVPGGDEWLLKQTGTKADPNVREQMEKDIAVPEEEKKPNLWNRWFSKNKDEN